ncbi:hypothetical protein PENSPDRAFT_543846, partial [Peniophora sp. CONT]
LVGVIPGPKEPRKQNLHHFLCPLVDDLLRLWSPGIVLSRTATATEVLVRAVLLPFVADAPALRKAVGLKSFSSKVAPCSLCGITKDQLNNFDIHTWPRRTAEYHRHHGRRWRDADEKEREKIADETGIRWSELLRLPYWDPTKFAVIDAMHNLFLAALCRHLAIVWGMQWKPSNSRQSPESDADSDGDSDYAEPTKKGKRKVHSPDQQATILASLASDVERKSKSIARNYRLDYLRAFAAYNGIEVTATATKEAIAQALVNWRNSFPADEVQVPDPRPYDTDTFELDDAPSSTASHILNNAELMWIWDLAMRVHIPSWIDRGPKRFGKSGQGHIKADQWRTIATILLPLVLIPQWSPGGQRHDASRAAILANFLDLVAAVTMISAKSVTARRIERMRQHLRDYCEGLRLLFPNYAIPPSLHQSFHLPELLYLFGPVTSFWGFPFERFNGVMHNFNHNGRRGMLEQSLFWSFCRASYLRHVMERLAALSKLLPFCRVFDRTFHYDNVALARAFFSADTEAGGSDEAPNLKSTEAGGTPTTLDGNGLRELAKRLNAGLVGGERYTVEGGTGRDHVVLSPQIMLRRHFTRDTIKYAGVTNSRRDYHVLAHVGLAPEATAGRIIDVFDHTHPGDDGSLITETFVIFAPYVPLSAIEAPLDPFHQYKDIGAKSFHTHSERLVVVKPEDVVGHFA